MKNLKRLLFQVHRWVGVVLALFMLLWFFSGLVIIYSGSITPSRSDKLAHSELLLPETGWLSLGEAWKRSAEQRNTVKADTKAEGGGKANAKTDNAGIADARLIRQAGEPLWLVEDARGQRFALSAIDGKVQNITPERALKVAQNWEKDGTGNELPAVSYVETLEKPIIVRNQDALRPFHLFAVDDGAGTELMVSARTGEVVHASTRIDRGFYYAGNWMHLFKYLENIGLGEIRRDALTWTGFAATVATLTGLIIGWMRWRPGFRGRPTYSQGRTQPYRDFWFRWHFWAGLIGGTFALTSAFSGFIDNNPFKMFSEANANRKELVQYQGSKLPTVMHYWRPAPLSINNGEMVELNWRRLGDEAVLLAYLRNGERRPLKVFESQGHFSDEALLDGVSRLLNKDSVTSTQVLQKDYDSYYYPQHDQGALERPLPVLRVDLADAGATRIYLDPVDGRLLSKQDQSRRVFRWLYSGLHHWDFGWLYYRPIWDIWMVSFVLFGLVLSGTSVVIGWKRLKMTFPAKKTATRKARYPAKPSTEESTI